MAYAFRSSKGLMIVSTVKWLLVWMLLTCLPCVSMGATEDDDLFLLTIAARIGQRTSASASIGVAGGSIEVGPARVVIPRNTFGAPVTVSLVAGSNQGVFLGQAISKIYNLLFTADGINQALTVTISSFGGPDRDVVIALADMVSDAQGTSKTLPALVTGRVRSGVLTFTIPRTDREAESSTSHKAVAASATDTQAGTPTQTGFTFWALAGFSTIQSAHFILYYPAAILAGAPSMDQTILNNAENAYTLLSGMGFSMAGLNTRVVITVQNGMGVRDGEVGIPLSGKGGQYMNLNTNLCTAATLEKLRATIGHEFFHMVQNLYDPRSALRIRHPSSHPYFLWLAEASSVWFESIILGSTSYMADVFETETNVGTYKKGLETYTDHAEAQAIGYSASGFLRHLVVARGANSLVYDFWKEVRKEGLGTAPYSDLTAVIRGQGTGMDTAIKWTNYIQRLLTKTTGHAKWPEPPSTKSAYWYSNSVFKTSVDWVGSIAPFSAAKIKVLFNKLQPNENKFIVKTTGPDTIDYALYKGSGNPPKYVREGTFNSLTPRKFTVAEGDAIIVTASNSETTPPYKNPISANVSISPSGSASKFCPGIPDTAIKYIDDVDHSISWMHETRRNVVAREEYNDEAKTKIHYASCRIYETGCPTMNTSWYDNGIKYYEEPLDCAGKRHGLFKSYKDSGKPYGMHTYLHGVLHGIYTDYWYSNDYIFQTGFYANGVQDGTWHYYYPNGFMYKKCIYTNGVPACTYN